MCSIVRLLGTQAMVASLPIGHWTIALGPLFAGLLWLGLLLIALDRARCRSRQLEAMNAITSMAVEASNSSSMMQTAMNELCRLYRCNFAWFQLVEGKELILKQHLGLPEWFTESRLRLPLSDSVIMPQPPEARASRVSVRRLPAGSR